MLDLALKTTTSLPRDYAVWAASQWFRSNPCNCGVSILKVMKQQYVKQDGKVNGIDFDAHYQVKGYRSIAFYLLGYSAEDKQLEEAYP